MFNEKLTGFSSDGQVNNKSIVDQAKSEIIATMKELQEIYESLKHFPGKHNQEDHAWNAGISNSKKKRTSGSGGSGRSSLSSFRRSAFNKRYTRKTDSSGGISSPFEAVSAASAQARTLGVTNPLALIKAVTVASNLLRSWSDKYKAALSLSESKVAGQLAKEFEKLSKTISDLGKKLGDDTVAQNVYKSIMKSYQDSIMTSIPETKAIFEKYSLYDESTPDKKMAKKVEQTIVETQKEAE
jgi:hypothetical protein